MYHPYWKWEEIKHNMWGSVEDHDKYLAITIILMSDDRKFGSYMIQVVNKWRYSCEHNLTNTTQNRIAWLGQAACALALNCPEYIVREAWWKLSEKQQHLANQQAESAINYWEKNIYAKNRTK